MTSVLTQNCLGIYAEAEGEEADIDLRLFGMKVCDGNITVIFSRICTNDFRYQQVQF